MQHLIGTYECKADAKGRIMLPIAIKKQLAAVTSGGFVLKRAVFNPCLELYPIKEWLGLMEKVNSLNRFNKKNNDFIRRFTAGVKTVEMDISGRLLIPKDLVLHSKILKDVVDYFVVCEADKTHTGQYKGYNFDKNFISKYGEKIIYIQVDDLPEIKIKGKKDYQLLKIQMENLFRGVVEAKDDDLIIFSDEDEIPNPKSISLFKKNDYKNLSESLLNNKNI